MQGTLFDIATVVAVSVTIVCSTLIILVKYIDTPVGKQISASIAPRLISDMSKRTPEDITSLFNIYNQLQSTNIAVFGALISACRRANQPQKALTLLSDMDRHSINLNSTVFHQLLGACKDTSTEQSRDAVSKLACKWNLNPQLSDNLQSSCVLLMKELVRHGDLDTIWECYKTLCKYAVPTLGVIGTMAVACAKGNSPGRIRDVLSEMRKFRIPLDRGCFMAIAEASDKANDIELAHWLFRQLQNNFGGQIEYAQLTRVFVDLESLDDAMKLLHLADSKQVVPNVFMYTSLLSGCAKVTSLEIGQIVLQHLAKHGVAADGILQNATIQLFARCAAFTEATTLFGDLHKQGFQPDIFTWNIMINLYSVFGMGEEAEATFSKMVASGIKSDAATFTCLLSAFVHSKQPDKALHYYNAMAPTYQITPNNHHHACIVDVLARLNHYFLCYKF